MAWLSTHVSGPNILILVGALIAALGTVWASMQQAHYERELRQKSEEIAELNRTIAASVTGGDSFCFLQIAAADTPTRHVVVASEGRYPLYDVQVRIVDLIKFEASKSLDVLMGTTFNVGNLSPKTASLVGQMTLPDSDEAKYNVFITARNGPVTELLRLRKVNGTWKTAMKVQRDSGNGTVVLKEQVDPDFPRNPAGEVAW